MGSAYSAQLSAKVGSGPSIKWIPKRGSGQLISAGLNVLPPGLVLGSNGAITGTPTPTAMGTTTFYVVASDATGASPPTKFTININAALAIPTASPLPNGTLGAAYAGVTFSAIGGSNSYSFSGQAPAGLTISSAGTLSGVPNALGTFNFNVTVTDSFGAQASKTFSITIVAPFTISTLSPLASGTIGVGYFQTIGATGGTPPYTFAVPQAVFRPALP